jgi:predicted esterase
MISLSVIHEPRTKYTNLVVALTGRGVSAGNMLGFIMEMGLDESVVVSMEPINREWYPLPNGAEDQQSAINGVNSNFLIVQERISSLMTMFNLPINLVSLVGYSAGGVMALKLMEQSKNNYGSVSCVAGTILDPENLSLAQNDTPVLLKHNRDDECFSWEERYVPTREALYKQGYNLFVEEKPYGGHGVCLEDAHLVGRFIRSNIE